MGSWRLSKYDPALRDEQGRFTGQDWTSVSDIGRVFGGRLVTAEAYLAVEDAHVEACLALHEEAGAPPLFARDVEGHPGATIRPGREVRTSLIEDECIARGELPAVIRSCLREVTWCRLEADDAAHCSFHFGYDYYVYWIGHSLGAATRARVQALGLFVEPFESPYRPVDSRGDG
jgi:hypothetical protein